MSTDVTLANWRTAPFSQYAFQHVGEVVPTARIAADPGDLWPLQVAPKSLDGFALGGGDTPMDLAGFMTATTGDALLVMLDGKIVHETYANGMTAQTPHILMSASKSVTGLIAGILADRGALDVAASVSSVLPEMAGTPYADTPVRDLLDMRVGLDFDLATTQAYAAATGWDPADPPSDLHSFLSSMTAATSGQSPFRYLSSNTDLLGWIIERVGGDSFANLVSELLWKPLGAEHDASITLDPCGAPRCTGGFSMVARDFARLGQLMVQDGARGARQIVPAAWIADIEQNGDRQAWAKGEWAGAFGAKQASYRGNWYVVDDDPAHIFAMGIHGQNLFVDRAHRLVVVKFSTWPQPIDYRAMALTHHAFAEIRRLVVG